MEQQLLQKNSELEQMRLQIESLKSFDNSHKANGNGNAFVPVFEDRENLRNQVEELKRELESAVHHEQVILYWNISFSSEFK